jgi:hypothetical protein
MFDYFNMLTPSRNQKINGKVAISLDGWTSSNNYGFLAIVAHYVHPVTGELGVLRSFFFTILFPLTANRGKSY